MGKYTEQFKRLEIQPKPSKYKEAFEKAERQASGVSTALDASGATDLYEGGKGIIDILGEMLQNKNNDPRNPAEMVKRVEMFKKVATAPLKLVTAAVGVPAALAMKYSGADKAVAQGINSLPKGAQEPVSTALEVGGALLSKGPVKVKRLNIEDVATALKQGAKTTPGQVEGLLSQTVNKTLENVKTQVYGPMEAALKQIKTPYFVGKASAKEIRDYVASLQKSGDLSPTEAAKFLSVADNAAQYNRIPDLLNYRGTADRTALQIKAEYGIMGNKKLFDFVDKVQSDIRKIINKNIENGIAQSDMPEMLPKLKEANRIYGTSIEDLGRIESKLNMKSGRQVQGIIDEGVDAINSAKRLGGEKNFTDAAYNSIAEKSFNMQGEFEPKAFARAIDKIGPDRGVALFGDTWPRIYEFARLMDKPGMLGGIVGKMPVINKLGFLKIIDDISKFNKQKTIDYNSILQSVAFDPQYLMGASNAVTSGINSQAQDQTLNAGQGIKG